jgi:hypothetical protein
MSPGIEAPCPGKKQRAGIDRLSFGGVPLVIMKLTCLSIA